MEGALGWLGDIARTIGQFFPRFLIVRTTHGGVAWIRGSKIKEVKPGFRVYWPFWTEISLYPVVRQSLNLPNQTLTTKDGRSVVVSGIVIYRVRNIVAALTKQWDLAETVRDLSMAALRKHVRGSTFDCLNEQERVDLKGDIQSEIRGYGVEILQAELTDFAAARVLSLVTNGERAAFVDDGEGE